MITSVDERLALIGRLFLATVLENIEGEIRAADLEGDDMRMLEAVERLEIVESFLR